MSGDLLSDLRREAQDAATRPDGSYCVRERAAAYVALLEAHAASSKPQCGTAALEVERMTLRGATEHLRDGDRKTEPGKSRRGNDLPATLPARDAHGNALRLKLERCHRSDVVRAMDAEWDRREASGARYEALLALHDRMVAASADVVGRFADPTYQPKRVAA